MAKHLRNRMALLVANLLFAMTAAHAGRSCEDKKPSVQSIEQSMDLAEKTRAALDASGQRVVILARAGQDLTKYGLHYSHLGFAYQQPEGGKYVWRVLHKLNECGTASSAIYRQGLGEFFLDDLWRYQSAYVVLAPEVQDRLMTLMADATQATSLHHRPYSIVSYAWGARYQQSNQWAIETLAKATATEIRSRSQAQGWLQAKRYKPSTVNIGPLARLGARVTAANVAFDDHPAEKRFRDRIETVTVDSVFDWLEQSGLGGRPVVIGKH